MTTGALGDVEIPRRSGSTRRFPVLFGCVFCRYLPRTSGSFYQGCLLNVEESEQLDFDALLSPRSFGLAPRLECVFLLH